MQVTIWNENVHEKSIPEMKNLHPGGLRGTLAAPDRIVPELYAPYIEITREEARNKGVEPLIRKW